MSSSAVSSLRPFNEIPGPSRIHYIYNQLKNRGQENNYFHHLSKLHEKYGKLVRNGSVLHVFDPEDSRIVFASDGRQPHIVPLQETTQKYRQMRGMNPGLGNLNGDEWYRLRSAVQQSMMRPQAVHKYLPYTNEIAFALVNHIESSVDKNGMIDMQTIAGRWSLESSGWIVFEKRLGAMAENIHWADRLLRINKDIFILSAKLKFALPLYKYLPTPKWRKMVELEDKFYREADKLMNEAIEKLKRKSVGENEMLFTSHLINKPELSINDVKVVLLSLFSDGLSTTAPMLVYNLYNIAMNPDIQEEVRKEINSIVSANKEISAVDINNLQLLRACIKETFRLFPIGTEISRIPQKDITLRGYNIPAGTNIDINTNILMRDSSVFSDPLSFSPSRWLRSNDKSSSPHPFAFLPFGFGPRMCAGRRFAEQDLAVVLARLIQSFSISHPSPPIKQIYQTLLLPTGNPNFVMKKIL